MLKLTKPLLTRADSEAIAVFRLIVLEVIVRRSPLADRSGFGGKPSRNNRARPSPRTRSQAKPTHALCLRW